MYNTKKHDRAETWDNSPDALAILADLDAAIFAYGNGGCDSVFSDAVYDAEKALEDVRHDVVCVDYEALEEVAPAAETVVMAYVDAKLSERMAA